MTLRGVLDLLKMNLQRGEMYSGHTKAGQHIEHHNIKSSFNAQYETCLITIFFFYRPAVLDINSGVRGHA